MNRESVQYLLDNPKLAKHYAKGGDVQWRRLDKAKLGWVDSMIDKTEFNPGNYEWRIKPKAINVVYVNIYSANIIAHISRDLAILRSGDGVINKAVEFIRKK